VTAANYALEVVDHIQAHRSRGQVNVTDEEAARLLLGTHMAHLDSDDIWKPDHLSVLASMYQRFPNVSFAFTRAMNSPRGAYPGKKASMKLPMAAGMRQFRWTHPVPCHSISSSNSFRIGSITAKTRVRTILEQLQSKRARLSVNGTITKSFHPFLRCPFYRYGTQQGFFAGDMDWWDQLWDLRREQRIASLLALNVTVIHTSAAYKKLLHMLLRQTYCSSDEVDVRKGWSGTSWANSSSEAHVLAGRRERLRRLFWPHSVASWTSPVGSMVRPGHWRPGRLLHHPDYHASLDAFRNLAAWIQLEPVGNTTHGEQGEFLHLVRPLLDIACQNRSRPCHYVEVGDYCGKTLALALTFPRLTHATQIGYSDVETRACRDGTANLLPASPDEKLEFQDAVLKNSVPLPKRWRCGRLTTCRNPYRMAGEMQQRIQCVNRSRAQKISFLGAEALAAEPDGLAKALDSTPIDVLLLSRPQKVHSDGATTLRGVFDRLSAHVAVGGIVVLDQYLTDSIVARTVDGDHAYGMTQLPWSKLDQVGGLYNEACTTDFLCIGPVANWAHAMHASKEVTSAYNPAFIMTRVAVSREKPQTRKKPWVAASTNPDSSPKPVGANGTFGKGRGRLRPTKKPWVAASTNPDSSPKPVGANGTFGKARGRLRPTKATVRRKKRGNKPATVAEPDS